MAFPNTAARSRGALLRSGGIGCVSGRFRGEFRLRVLERLEDERHLLLWNVVPIWRRESGSRGPERDGAMVRVREFEEEWA